jgi:two-component system, chemotaxis family, sensor kinase Cph1
METGPTTAEQSAAPGVVLDLTTCDREPIHIPGAIQPHGILFALSGPDLKLTAISANVVNHLGVEPATMLGRSVADFMDGQSFSAVKAAAAHQDNAPPELLHLRLTGTDGTPWRCGIHTIANGAVLEAKLPRSHDALDLASLFNRYDRATRRVRNAANAVMICQCLAEEVRSLTGYDRVKVYRFARDWSGEVIAEARSDTMPSFAGLHFPAADIPAQARALYVRNPERQIPDVHYKAVPLIQVDPEPIDLSGAMLRSVSPIHLEYLTNMAVGASMSVSIVRDGRLWGLVACHHRTPHYVSPDLRQASVLLAQLVSWQLTLVEEADTMRRVAGVKAIEKTLLHDTTGGIDYRETLLRKGAELLDLMQATGMTISRGASLTTIGATPPEEALRGLLGWLALRGPEVFDTAHLAGHYPPAAGWAMAAGILATPLGGAPDNLMLWFRPEIARTVTWGGEPGKPAATGRLNPRRSFEAWTEIVHGHSRPWEPHEVAAANSLRDMVGEIIMQRSMELEAINVRLTRTNEELEAFAYVASHDLKEPLRQIETFGTLLERAFNNKTAPATDPRRWFEGIRSSSRRLRVLIDDLAEYSRLGRHANPFGPCALGEVIEEVKSDLGILIDTASAIIQADPLPTIMCDHTQMRQVMQNLLSNAIKYRHPDRPPVIRIGATTQVYPAPGSPAMPTLELTFADNGIGFEERYRDKIFEPFQRLHSADDYEGSGIGLAICRKIIDRHGGSISAGSRLGEGSIFRITLPQRPLPDGV